jgi:hypothetical protein
MAFFAMGFLSPLRGLEFLEGLFTQGIALGYFLSALQAFYPCLSVCIRG